MPEVWSIFSNYLHFVREGFGVRTHSFVLMSNHFHLIVSTPEANLPQAMNYFMRETSRAISRGAGRINQTYGGPYSWSLLNSNHYFLNAYKYVYRNPVEARLAPSVQAYPYSTLHALLGKSRSIIPIENDETLFSEPVEQLRWLNLAYPSEDVRLQIQKALRKREFQFALGPDGKPNSLEQTLF